MKKIPTKSKKVKTIVYIFWFDTLVKQHRLRCDILYQDKGLMCYFFFPKCLHFLPLNKLNYSRELHKWRSYNIANHQ